jgi:uncharacterized membrane protein YczE
VTERRPRFVQLLISCAALGIGVGLSLTAALGSDGYSTLVNGTSIASHLPFLAVNSAVGAVLVALSWWRGVRPGWGTIIQPVIVGAIISGVLALTSTPDSWLWRTALLVAAFPILVVGVAGYLASGAGAGPAEAAALAFDPPVPFKWSYSVLQGGGALGGWLLGAAIGPGTLLVIFLLGPAVDLASARVRLLDISESGRPDDHVLIR